MSFSIHTVVLVFDISRETYCTINNSETPRTTSVDHTCTEKEIGTGNKKKQMNINKKHPANGLTLQPYKINQEHKETKKEMQKRMKENRLYLRQKILPTRGLLQ